MPADTHTLTERARLEGIDRGRAAGSWALDGSSSEADAERLLQGYRDGDPQVMDMQPSPLSGEWADDPSERDILEAIGADAEALEDGDRDELLTLFEEGYSEGYWDAVELDAMRALGLATASELEAFRTDAGAVLTLSDASLPLDVAVRFDRWDGDRARIAWLVQVGDRAAVGSDLSIPLIGGESELLARALGSLLSFLGAFAEAARYPDSDNRDLFAAGLRERIGDIGSDTLAMLELEVTSHE